MKNVLKRQVFYIQIQLESPLNVASGEDEWTDADILRDFEAIPLFREVLLPGLCVPMLEKERMNGICLDIPQMIQMEK